MTLHLHNGLVTIFRLYSALGLFVDAICIAQANVREKAQEVASVTKVYHRATSVPVWLGCEDGDSRKAIEHIYSLEDSLSDLREFAGDF